MAYSQDEKKLLCKETQILDSLQKVFNLLKYVQKVKGSQNNISTNRKYQQVDKNYKKEPNRKCRTEKYKNWKEQFMIRPQ